MRGGTLINVEPLVLVACAGTLVSLEESLHLLAVLLMPLVNVLLGRLVNLRHPQRPSPHINHLVGPRDWGVPKAPEVRNADTHFSTERGQGASLDDGQG